ncbi:hypothetical protein AAEH85_21890, partial [Shewanella algae]|uniref:hypothetical protein n=1 Tax=Shewanella algae TaxID=38313 RepID=UPI00313D9966
SGVASTRAAYTYAATGSLALSSSAVEQGIYQQDAAGRAALSGSASAYQGWQFQPSGRIRVHGPALVSKVIPNVTGFGDVALTGKAEV